MQAYTRGQILPTVIHHVSYSLLLVIAVIITTDHVLRSKNKWVLFGLLIALGWIIYMIHLLATRTGLLCLYVSLPVYLAGFCLYKKAYLVLGVSLVVLGGSGVILFQSTGTMRNKVDYVLYDMGQIRQNINSDNQLSDTRRLLSDRLGWEIAVKHPLAGVGIGDVKDVMKHMYDARYPEFKPETRGHIHNQFIYIFAGCGFLMGVLFIICMLAPVLIYFRNQMFVLGTAYLALLLVLFWEPFLEYQLGNTIYLLILALGVNQKTIRN
jgi:O-antigen ligase